MQYCPKCKVNIRGRKRCCPLCQGQLKESELTMEPAFPVVKKNKVSNITFMKVCTFIFIALEIVFGTINIMTEGVYSFIGVIMLGILVGWVTIITTLYLRNNLLKVLTWEVFVAIVVDVYIDIHTGFHGWSLMWMVPGTLIGLALCTVIIAKILKLRFDEYALYIVFDILMSLFQIIFIKNGMNKFPWPAVITIMLYLILGVALVMFRFRDLKNASEKMFNM